MKIGLIDADSHNFPNLCLMKIAAYHKGKGDSVEWWNGLNCYDIVYKSKVFTEEYSPEDRSVIRADQVFCGGTGYDLKNKLPDAMEEQIPDYSIYPQRITKGAAFGFLTRGCPRNCKFCIVSQKEGRRSEQVADLAQFWRDQGVIKLLDPNLLACRDHERLLEQLAASKAYVDFPRGLIFA